MDLVGAWLTWLAGLMVEQSVARGLIVETTAWAAASSACAAVQCSASCSACVAGGGSREGVGVGAFEAGQGGRV